MSQYTETTNYDLRKPVPDSSDTRNKWGIDLNRTFIGMDKICHDIDAQIQSTDGYLTTMNATTIPALISKLSTLRDRISGLEEELAPYLDRPDDQGTALDIINELASWEDWVDAHILRLQRFNADNYFYDGEMIIEDASDVVYYYHVVVDNGLIKSYERNDSST